MRPLHARGVLHTLCFCNPVLLVQAAWQASKREDHDIRVFYSHSMLACAVRIYLKAELDSAGASSCTPCLAGTFSNGTGICCVLRPSLSVCLSAYLPG